MIIMVKIVGRRPVRATGVTNRGKESGQKIGSSKTSVTRRR